MYGKNHNNILIIPQLNTFFLKANEQTEIESYIQSKNRWLPEKRRIGAGEEELVKELVLNLH